MRPANLNKYTRTFYNTCRKYSEEKSIYQKHEEGPKPREVFGKPYPEWRKPWIKRDGEWTSKLSVFVEKNPSPDIMYALSQVPHLTFDKIKVWWQDMKVVQEVQNQKFLPERVATLGSNLAAVHFFTFRQGKVRLRGSSEWLFGDAISLDLPSNYVDGYFVEAIDCKDFHHNGIRFEGLENLYGLNFLKWLSLKNNRHVDVWCIDRIAGQNGKSLEYLDISGCNICVGCVFSLARMKALKMLIITDPGDNIELQAALSMLEQEKPELLIKSVENTENVISQ
ncbi:distal membrane-arm assembly complex protein 2 [Achroia grisella]|uniref:distal membrane-arm assembly complex protein 2 n=1 Tax=Achroia grisella TaxID=688607 RepID=UPI0027D2B298|nr:distal membrane-arm assembly complex protein 2 [Achroia grisella]